jgi:septum formation protein
MTRLYLASKSPRRKMLLSQLTNEYELCDVDIEEQPTPSESPSDYVVRISIAKAMSARLHVHESFPVLSADTEVVCNGRILGKPGNHCEAVDMLMLLSGHVHEVYTAVVLLSDKAIHIINQNRVWFRTLDKNECEQYCKKYQPMDKAGGYGIQDIAAGFITRFEGSYSGVMGLPLSDTRKLLLGTINIL